MYNIINCRVRVSLFLTVSVLVANPKKLLYTVPSLAARGLLNRGKNNKRKSVAAPPRPPPPPPAARSEKISDASTCLGATQVSVRLASVQQGFLRLVGWASGCRFAKFYASVCDKNFPSLVASIFSWRSTHIPVAVIPVQTILS